MDHLKSWPLALLPHRLLSHLVRRATRWQAGWWKRRLIHAFAARFAIDMSEAAEPDLDAYPDFNRFFTRALRADARTWPDDERILASPVDGTVSAAGPVSQARLLQAKGVDYSLAALLGGDTQLAQQFENGRFATLYLSPRDYHRIHMPCSGTLVSTTYVPGRLYSVAPHTTRAVSGLFARNERLVACFETAHGPLAMVMVGAIFVSCMETTWAGVVNPRLRARLQHERFDGDGPRLARGAEMGRFNMGSTVILVCGPGMCELAPELASGQPVRLGQALGTLQN